MILSFKNEKEEPKEYIYSFLKECVENDDFKSYADIASGLTVRDQNNFVRYMTMLATEYGNEKVIQITQNGTAYLYFTNFLIRARNLGNAIINFFKRNQNDK